MNDNILQFPKAKTLTNSANDPKDSNVLSDLEAVKTAFEKSRNDFFKLSPNEKYQLFEVCSKFGEDMFAAYLEQQKQLEFLELQLMALAELLKGDEE